MDEIEHQRQVQRTFERAMEQDHAKTFHSCQRAWISGDDSQTDAGIP